MSKKVLGNSISDGFDAAEILRELQLALDKFGGETRRRPSRIRVSDPTLARIVRLLPELEVVEEPTPEVEPVARATIATLLRRTFALRRCHHRWSLRSSSSPPSSIVLRPGGLSHQSRPFCVCLPSP